MSLAARVGQAIGWRWREFAQRSGRVLRPTRLASTVLYTMSAYRLIGRTFWGLNLGGGDSVIDGFWSIDANMYSLSDVIGSIDRIRLRDCSVGIIYCSHVLEHMPRAKSGSVLAEWFRVLKPGGRLYVAVPDMEVVCQLYLDRLKACEEDPDASGSLEVAAGIIYGGQGNRYNFHRSGYAFRTLKALLESVGFVGVERFCADSAPFRLPSGDGASAVLDGVPVSLNVSAEKPEQRRQAG